jgi:hypothetical protein
VGLVLEGATLKDKIEGVEKRVVAEVLHRHRWNQSRAAKELGLSRVGRANKIKRNDLDKAEGARRFPQSRVRVGSSGQPIDNWGQARFAPNSAVRNARRPDIGAVAVGASGSAICSK